MDTEANPVVAYLSPSSGGFGGLLDLSMTTVERMNQFQAFNRERENLSLRLYGRGLLRTDCPIETAHTRELPMVFSHD